MNREGCRAMRGIRSHEKDCWLPPIMAVNLMGVRRRCAQTINQSASIALQGRLTFVYHPSQLLFSISSEKVQNSSPLAGRKESKSCSCSPCLCSPNPILSPFFHIPNQPQTLQKTLMLPESGKTHLMLNLSPNFNSMRVHACDFHICSVRSIMHHRPPHP